MRWLLLVALVAACGKDSPPPAKDARAARVADAGVARVDAAVRIPDAAIAAPAPIDAAARKPDAAPASPPPAKPPPTPTAAGPGRGEPCAEDGTCATGLECVTYYGIAGPRGPKFTSCENPCKDKATCPAGTTCQTIADGPGQVCR